MSTSADSSIENLWVTALHYSKIDRHGIYDYVQHISPLTCEWLCLFQPRNSSVCRCLLLCLFRLKLISAPSMKLLLSKKKKKGRKPYSHWLIWMSLPYTAAWWSSVLYDDCFTFTADVDHAAGCGISLLLSAILLLSDTICYLSRNIHSTLNGLSSSMKYHLCSLHCTEWIHTALFLLLLRSTGLSVLCLSAEGVSSPGRKNIQEGNVSPASIFK